MGAKSFGPGPLANRSHPTKDYNWADPVGLACEPNLRTETHTSSPTRKGAAMLCMSSISIGDFI